MEVGGLIIIECSISLKFSIPIMQGKEVHWHENAKRHTLMKKEESE